MSRINFIILSLLFLFSKDSLAALTFSPSSTFTSNKPSALKALDSNNVNVTTQYNFEYIDADPTIKELDIILFAGAPTISPIIAGSYTIKATKISDPTIIENIPITIVAGPANKITVVSGSNQSAPVNTQLPLPLIAKVVDIKGNAVSNAAVNWTAAAGTFSSPGSTSGADGTFQNTYTTGPTATSSTVSAALASSPLIKASFTVIAKATSTANTPSKLSITTPISANKDSPFSASVSVLDSLGTVVSTATNSVSINAYSNNTCSTPAAGILSGTKTVNSASGIATFSGISYNAVGSIYILASSTGLTSACSKLITVSDPATAVPTKLSFIYPPLVGSVQNSAFSPNIKLSLQDSAGKLVSGGAYSVTISSYSNSTCTTPTTSPLSGILTATSSAGSVSFPGVSYPNVQSIYIKATAAGLTSACSPAINVTQDVSTIPTSLKITQISVSADKGKIFLIQPKVSVFNSSKSLVTAAQNPPISINIAAYSDAACSILASSNLTGVLSLSPVSGVASFSGISYPAVGTIYVKASANGLVSDCSALISITEPAAGVPYELVYSQQPAPQGNTAQPLTRQPILEIRDILGAKVLTGSLSVVLGYYIDSGCLSQATSIPPNSAFSSSGLATFSNIKIPNAGTYYIKASSGTLKPACSSSVTIEADLPPLATNQTVNMDEDTTAQITLNAADPENKPLTYLKQSDPQHGTLTMSSTSGNWTYTPNLNYSGQDSFSYKVSDGILMSDVAVVTINISPANDPPVAIESLFSTTQDNPVFQQLLQGHDPDGDELIFTIVSNGTKGVASLAEVPNTPLCIKGTPCIVSKTTITHPPGTFSYYPNPGVIGTDYFTFTVSDGINVSEPKTITIRITGDIYNKPFVFKMGDQGLYSNPLLFATAGPGIDISVAASPTKIFVAKGPNFFDRTKLGMYYSSNGGNTFGLVQSLSSINPTTGETYYEGAYSVYYESGKLYVNYGNKLFLSSDDGTSFVNKNEALGLAVAQAYLGSPPSSVELNDITGPAYSLYRFPLASESGSATSGIAASGNNVYLTTACDFGLAVSHDGGNSFSIKFPRNQYVKTLNTSLGKTTINCLSNQSVKILGVSANGPNVLVWHKDGVSISHDYGETFVKKTVASGIPSYNMMSTNGSLIENNAFIRKAYYFENKIYMIQDYSGKIIISSDNGNTFYVKNLIIPTGSYCEQNDRIGATAKSTAIAYDIAVTPDAMVVSSTDCGLFISYDGGDSYVLRHSPDQTVLGAGFVKILQDKIFTFGISYKRIYLTLQGWKEQIVRGGLAISPPP